MWDEPALSVKMCVTTSFLIWQVWDEPALSLKMCDVVSASTATGIDFFKAVFVLEQKCGRALQLRASSRHEMRSLLGLMHMHCLSSSGGDGVMADEHPRSVRRDPLPSLGEVDIVSRRGVHSISARWT